MLKKKLTSIILVSIIALSVTACNGPQESPPEPAVVEKVAEVSDTPTPTEQVEDTEASSEEENEKTDENHLSGILESQAQREKEIFDDYSYGTYTIENPYIVQDPYELNPLTALVLFEVQSPDNITITVPGDDNADTLAYECKVEGGRAEIPIFGLYPGRDNQVELKDSTGYTSQLQIKTESLPDIFPKVEIITSQPEKMVQGLTLLTEFVAGNFMVDTKGDVRWWINKSQNFGNLSPFLELENGHYAIFGGEMQGAYYMESVYEVDLLGKVYKEFKLPGKNGHHEIREMPNGNLIIAVGAPDNSTDEDHIIELDRETGDVIKSINLKNSVPMPDYIADPAYVELRVQEAGETYDEAEAVSRRDWFHNNSFFYDESDNSLIISARSLDAVIKVDYDTEGLIWVLTDPASTWAQAPGIKEKLLTPTGAEFEYQYGQHGVSLLPSGDLILLDNGCFRSKDLATRIDDKENYSRAVQYKVNEEDLTVEQIWQYGKERGNELLSAFVSNVEYLEDRHYLMNFGGIVADEEGFNSSSNFATGECMTIITELKDDEVIFELKLTEGIRPNTYRAVRVDLGLKGQP